LIQWLSLPSGEQRQAGVLGFHSLKQTIFRDRTKVRENQESDVFAAPHAALIGTERQCFAFRFGKTSAGESNQVTRHREQTPVCKSAQHKQKRPHTDVCPDKGSSVNRNNSREAAAP
jgi:hypothetical protein